MISTTLPRRFVAATCLGLAMLSATVVLAGDRPSSARGLDGKPVTLAAPAGGAAVIVFYSTECPISNAYSPALKALRADYPADKLAMVGVCVDPDLSDRGVAAHKAEYALDYPVVRDRRGVLARAFGVRVTPEVAVLDQAGDVRYLGRIDDQYAARLKRNANPATHELRDAVAALTAGKPVAVARVEAVGCPLPVPPAKVEHAPTYSGEVAAILQANCQECHRPGQVGPFSLLTYEQARKRADDLASVVEDRRMPPWKPVAGAGMPFAHDKSMSQADIDTLIAWADAGAPEGDPSLAPAPRAFSDGWALGTPDLIVDIGTDFEVPAAGGDIYRCFVIPTNLPEKVAVSAVEYRPGNASVVHHALGFVDTKGAARKKDEAEAGPGYACFGGPGFEAVGDMGGWAPGNEPKYLPDGVGRLLPSGADLVVQVHYHPSGKPEVDRTRIGLYFAKTPIRQTMVAAAAADPDHLELPAGKANIATKASWKVPVDVDAFSVTPHMHMRGRDITMTALLPDGTRKPLIRIDDWDFNWQNTYKFRDPLFLPAGTVVEAEGHFDNSAENPRNPVKPPIDVHWGEGTHDEMFIGFISVAKHGQDLTRPGEEDDLGRILLDQRKKPGAPAR
jgi:mono/diheme cytochrome c family protein